MRAKRKLDVSSVIVGKDHVTVDGRKIRIRRIRRWAWHTNGIRIEFAEDGATKIQDAVTEDPQLTFETVNISVTNLYELWLWLQQHRLSDHFDAFLEYGVKGLEDLKGDPEDFKLEDLAEMGLSRLRFLRARIVEEQRLLLRN